MLEIKAAFEDNEGRKMGETRTEDLRSFLLAALNFISRGTGRGASRLWQHLTNRDLLPGRLAKIEAIGKGSLSFLLASGLALYFFRFNEFGQVILLTHILAGVLTGWCGLVYVARHSIAFWKQDAGLSWWMAFLALVGVAIGIVTGYRLSFAYWFNVFNVETAATWHNVAMFIVLITVPVHIVTVWRSATRIRKRSTRRRENAIAATTFVALSCSVSILWGYRTPEAEVPVPHDYVRSDDGTLFGPSLLQTKHNGMFRPESLQGSDQCAACHSQIAEEWSASAHRFSGMENELLAAATREVQGKIGRKGARFCGSCHEPVAMLSGHVDDDVFDIPESSSHTGITCLVCHGSTDIPGFEGNAQINFAVPDAFLFHTSTNFFGRGLNRLIVRSRVEQHREQMNPSTIQTSHQCSGCHRVNATENFNGFGFIRLHQENDDWEVSQFSHGVGPDGEVVRCQDCHMMLVPDSKDPVALRNDGKHRSHRFLAANTFLAKFHGGEEQLRLTEAFLRGEIRPEEIDHLLPDGPPVTLEIEAPSTITPGRALDFGVIIHNNWVGHGFPQGPIEVHETWLEVIVTDAGGERLYASGLINEEGRRDPEAFALIAKPVDAEGNELDATAALAVGFDYRKNILSGYSERATYEVPLPPRIEGPLTISTRLLYRKADFEFQVFAFGEALEGLPITEIASTTIHLPAGV